MNLFYARKKPLFWRRIDAFDKRRRQNVDDGALAAAELRGGLCRLRSKDARLFGPVQDIQLTIVPLHQRRAVLYPVTVVAVESFLAAQKAC